MSSLKNMNFWKGNTTVFKSLIVIGLNLFGAIALTYILVILLTYLNLIGEFASDGIYVVWKKIGTFLLPTTILVLSVLVITLSNPVYALVCLIVVFFSTALFLLSINVNFLALIYLIIYIGAIAILFLFVIMMFNLKELQKQSTEINDYSFLSISFWLYFLVLSKFYSLFLDYIWTYIEYDSYFNVYVGFKKQSLTYYLTYQYLDSFLFGNLLYTYYSYIFLVGALILLTAMLGSIILALSTTEKSQGIKY